MKIDSDAIKKLAELLDETGLNEIEVVEGEQAIRVNKGAQLVAPAVSQASISAGVPVDPATPGQTSAGTPEASAASHPGAVKAPMVGTAYMQSEPGAAPFVSKGKTVNAGDTLLIIEAMKVMNPIKAEKGGTVTQVLFEDGQPVEYGDILLVIE